MSAHGNTTVLTIYPMIFECCVNYDDKLASLYCVFNLITISSGLRWLERVKRNEIIFCKFELDGCKTKLVHTKALPNEVQRRAQTIYSLNAKIIWVWLSRYRNFVIKLAKINWKSFSQNGFTSTEVIIQFSWSAPLRLTATVLPTLQKSKLFENIVILR